MIDLYTWTTPNGRKVSIALEELQLPYAVHPIDIGKDEQFQPDFLRISPNNKIPAIVDHATGLALMESGAILLYLADKTGRLHGSGKYGWQAVEWLMMQMGSVGPMLGQAHHFLRFNRGKSAYAEKRYGDEAKRIYGVLDRRLHDAEYLAGDYSIADIATWPWIARYEWQGVDFTQYPSLRRWYSPAAIEPIERPATITCDLASASGFSVTGPVAAAELMTAEPSGDVAAAPRSPVLASTTSAGTAIRA